MEQVQQKNGSTVAYQSNTHEGGLWEGVDSGTRHRIERELAEARERGQSATRGEVGDAASGLLKGLRDLQKSTEQMMEHQAQAMDRRFHETHARIRNTDEKVVAVAVGLGIAGFFTFALAASALGQIEELREKVEGKKK